MPDPALTPVVLPAGVSPLAGTIITILVLAGGQLATVIFRTIDNRRLAREAKDAAASNAIKRDGLAERQVEKLGEIHDAVNGNMGKALAKVEALEAEVKALREAVGCPFVTEKAAPPGGPATPVIRSPPECAST